MDIFDYFGVLSWMKENNCVFSSSFLFSFLLFFFPGIPWPSWRWWCHLWAWWKGSSWNQVNFSFLLIFFSLFSPLFSFYQKKQQSNNLHSLSAHRVRVEHSRGARGEKRERGYVLNLSVHQKSLVLLICSFFSFSFPLFQLWTPSEDQLPCHHREPLLFCQLAGNNSFSHFSFFSFWSSKKSTRSVKFAKMNSWLIFMIITKRWAGGRVFPKIEDSLI